MDIVAVTRNNALHCTTVQTILGIAMQAIQKNIHYTIHLINEGTDLKKYQKHSELFVFLDYGASMDSCEVVFQPFPKGYNVVCFPALKEGIHWSKIRERTNEPIEQRCLEFDVTLGKKLTDEYYEVLDGTPRVWVAKKTKGEIRRCAYVKVKTTMHYSHEAIGSVIESSGINILD